MTTPYATAAIKAVKSEMKRQRKERKQRKEHSNTTAVKSAAQASIDGRVREIVRLQKAVVRKGLSDEERRGVAGELLRAKLAAREEVALARAGQQAAIAAATGKAINRPMSSNRQAVASVYDGSYTTETLPRSLTESPAQRKIMDLEDEFRHTKDPLEKERLGYELTGLKLSLHAQGRL